MRNRLRKFWNSERQLTNALWVLGVLYIAMIIAHRIKQ